MSEAVTGEVPEQVQRAARERKGYVDVPWGQAHYRELGAGRPVVFLHKTPSSSLMFTHVLPLVARAGYRAIAIDTPGYGASDPPAEPPATLEPYAQAVIAVADALGLERLDLVGFYTGASIALEVATSRPDRVGRLVLAGLVAFEGEADRAEFTARIAELGKMKAGLALDGEGRFLDEYPIGWLRDYLRGDGEQFLLETRAYLDCATRYWWAYEAVVASSSADHVRRLARPTLFLHPAEGLEFVGEGTRRAHALAPGSRFLEIPGTTEVCMEDPAAFTEPVLAFLGDAD